jgi:hypothetical protein
MNYQSGWQLEGHPQELMRRWKASRPDHELGIQTHTTLLRKARKEVIWGTETEGQESRVERTISRREEKHVFDSGVERKAEKQARFGNKKPWAGFRYKLINEDDE